MKYSLPTVFATFLFSSMAFAQSHFDLLKDKYQNDTNSNISIQAIKGATLGRCFRSSDDTPIGMVLVAFDVSSTQNADEGPLFPPATTTSYKMVLGLMGGVSSDGSSTEAASDNDNTKAADWVSQFTSDSGVGNLSISSGVASSTYSASGASASYQVKLGNDGLIYAHASESTVIDDYCYFYQKLN